jgi:amino acid permease
MFCNIISLLLPIVGYMAARLITKDASHGGNMGAAIGAGIVTLGMILLSAVLGAALAGTALYRGERYVWLSVLGLLVNLSVMAVALAPLIAK